MPYVVVDVDFGEAELLKRDEGFFENTGRYLVRFEDGCEMWVSRRYLKF